MKKVLLIIAECITRIANELGASCGGDTPSTPTPDPEATPKRRGRAPSNPTPPATETAPPEQTHPVETKVETPAHDAEAAYQKLRAVILPLVESGKGPEVKKVIAKYGTDLKDIATRPECHAAFEKDIEPLNY
jgi:hypothetical protein